MQRLILLWLTRADKLYSRIPFPNIHCFILYTAWSIKKYMNTHFLPTQTFYRISLPQLTHILFFPNRIQPQFYFLFFVYKRHMCHETVSFYTLLEVENWGLKWCHSILWISFEVKVKIQRVFTKGNFRSSTYCQFSSLQFW